jgi:leucyl-tRNA synthetase
MEYNSLDRKKWQRYWDENKILKLTTTFKLNKYYILDMFPILGQRFHVGHPEGYTATDIVARYKRMNGLTYCIPWLGL